eukprot:1825831-Pyramimonas_sp.AAC.1
MLLTSANPWPAGSRRPNSKSCQAFAPLGRRLPGAVPRRAAKWRLHLGRGGPSGPGRRPRRSRCPEKAAPRR